MLSDDELVRLRSGDDAYFAELDRRFTPMFRRYVRTSVRRPDDVEDVLQETWLHVVQRRATFRNQASLDSWLWAICRHTCTDWLRAQHRRAMLAERMQSLSDTRPPHQSEEQALQCDAAFRTLVDRVDQALRALPDRQFDAVFYRWLMGHPTKLSATLMHVAPGTVKATVHQAGERVRAQVPAKLVDEWIDTSG